MSRFQLKLLSLNNVDIDVACDDVRDWDMSEDQQLSGGDTRYSQNNILHIMKLGQDKSKNIKTEVGLNLTSMLVHEWFIYIV